MSEHRRIVTKDYPVEKLPEDLRAGREPGHKVIVTVEDEDEVTQTVPRWKRFQGIGSRYNTSIEEAVARVRALRDEWD